MNEKETMADEFEKELVELLKKYRTEIEREIVGNCYMSVDEYVVDFSDGSKFTVYRGCGL